MVIRCQGTGSVSSCYGVQCNIYGNRRGLAWFRPILIFILQKQPFVYKEDSRIPCDLHGMHWIITDWSTEELESARQQILQSFTESLVSNIFQVRILTLCKEFLKTFFGSWPSLVFCLVQRNDS